jgi:protein-tyrosine phosphatase
VIDIHSHVVWGLDDGPDSVEESLAMLASACASGTTGIVATPHFNPEYAFRADLLRQRIAELAERTGNRPEIHRGCEFHLHFDNLEDLLESPASYTINGKQFLLVELASAQIGRHCDKILDRLLEAGITPIVSHPERNAVLRRSLDRVEGWVERGCLMQVTANSITGGFGKSAQSAVTRLLERGLVHVVASDAHDVSHRPPGLLGAYAVVQSRYGDDAAEILFRENPRAIVQGDRLPGGKQVICASRPWWRFWKD